MFTFLGQAITKLDDMRRSVRLQRQQMELDLSQAPEEILIEIFLRVDAKILLKHCTRVCHKWNALLTQKSFWVSKTEHEGYLRDHQNLGALPLNFQKLCVKQPFERNLIRDQPRMPRIPFHKSHVCDGPAISRPGQAGYDARWEFSGTFQYEEPPAMRNNALEMPNCLATSSMRQSKRIIIDLQAEGIDAYILDNLRPSITVSEYTTKRFDCPARYRMSVGLMGAEDEEEMEKSDETYWEETVEMPDEDEERWRKVEHTFRQYPPGVRRIGVHTEGHDRRFWAGYYGAKMARCSVVVRLEFNQPTADAD